MDFVSAPVGRLRTGLFAAYQAANGENDEAEALLTEIEHCDLDIERLIVGSLVADGQHLRGGPIARPATQ